MKKEKVVIGDVTYYVAYPGPREEGDAKLESSKRFSEALESGACLREQLQKTLIKKGVWEDGDDKKLEDYTKSIQDNLKVIDSGGIDVYEARKLAIEIGKARFKMVNLLGKLREHDQYTVEGQADNAYFDSLVSSCCYNEDGSKLFKSYADYIEKSKEEYSVACAKKLGSMVYGINDDFYKSLPENKFLQEYGFLNDDLEFVNEEGETVDEDYKKVEIKEEEKVERKPFLKNGEPIVK